MPRSEGIGVQPAATDLLLPRPASGETWDPHTIHTHYFGFCVPEAELGAFIYVRYQPAFPLCQAGVSIFRGLDNAHLLAVEHMDYEITMPWPEVDASSITTANGLRLEFTEPGREVRLTYSSGDGAAAFDLVQTAVTPLFVRGHIMPGEDLVSDPSLTPTGSEQCMRCTGTLSLHGTDYAVDCHAMRDRSLSQLREERRGAVEIAPIAWTPMYFGPDLVLNQIGIEAPDTDPAWAGLYDIPADRPTHHWGWVYADGETTPIERVRRNVLEYHPTQYGALRQELEVVSADGHTRRFRGEAFAMAPVSAWPNVATTISMYRWEDEQGRLSHDTHQEVWFDTYHRAMKRRMGALR